MYIYKVQLNVSRNGYPDWNVRSRHSPHSQRNPGLFMYHTDVGSTLG